MQLFNWRRLARLSALAAVLRIAVETFLFVRRVRNWRSVQAFVFSPTVIPVLPIRTGPGVVAIVVVPTARLTLVVPVAIGVLIVGLEVSSRVFPRLAGSVVILVIPSGGFSTRVVIIIIVVAFSAVVPVI